VQQKLLQVLSEVYRPRGCVHGFVRNRSIVSNAARHTARAWVLNVDLKDFFPSINFGRVRGMFMAPPYRLPEAVATALAQVCCHENQLPQGAPTSPVVANMVTARMDGELLSLAREYRLTYSRFADDLTFSTSQRSFPSALAARPSPSALTTLGPHLEHVLTRNGFAPNPAKVRLQSRSVRQEVTGLTVNRTPNVQRAYIRQVRAMLHAWERFGLQAAADEFHVRFDRKHRNPKRGPAEFARVVKGKIDFLKMVRGDGHPIVVALSARFGTLVGRSPRAVPTLDERIRNAMWVLEHLADGPKGPELVLGTAFEIHGVGVITCDHVVADGTEAFRWNGAADRKHPTVLFRSEEMDLALLGLEPSGNALFFVPSHSPLIWSEVIVAGFPNYRPGDSGYFPKTVVCGQRQIYGYPRFLVDGPIVAGMSGGPTLNQAGEVIGVASTGASKLAEANETEWHGFIPASTIQTFIEAARSAGVIRDA